MRVICLCACLVVAIAGRELYRDTETMTSTIGDKDLLILDYHDSMGLVCDNGDEGNVAKVGCGNGNAYTSIGITDLAFENDPEFHAEMTCTGDESSLSDCSFEILKCKKFVACGSKKRGLVRDIL